METTLRYLAASANRYGHAAAISHDQSIIAFASHRFVVLWRLSVRSVHLIISSMLLTPYLQAREGYQSTRHASGIRGGGHLCPLRVLKR